MKRFLLASLLLAVGACGGKSSPSATPTPSPSPSPSPDTSCCCDYIKEEGDPAGDNWSENQTYEFMSATDCTDLSGTCTDASTCTATDATPDA